ncbi:MAG: type ISP restriction/modification enzyme [bacterium]|nr:type ISP restriction/modification enzyme [bacterium]
MQKLNLKPNSKEIQLYYETVHEKKQLGLITEGNVSPAFARLLGYCAKQIGYRLNEQHILHLRSGKTIKLDGAILLSTLRYGAWEAKDTQDTLEKEVKKKFADGYPKDNILFQSPDQAILYQNGFEVMNVRLDSPESLINILNAFFSYTTPAIEEWEFAINEFKTHIPQLAQELTKLIKEQYHTNPSYISAFNKFYTLCQRAINPRLSREAVEEMLIQHILTERIFRGVFKNSDFTNRNIIAKEIELVIQALTSKAFDRNNFMRGLDRFYKAIEITANTIDDYNEKQDFLNTIYERFFQGFSKKVADTHGIVYTPQSIVQFMVKSVEEILQKEFGGRSLVDKGVHILDPFVGTGNFILRIMDEIRQIKPSTLPHKYTHELHCNEIMLLPYYISSMNIEHAYSEAIGEYAPFEGICLVDTFEIAEDVTGENSDQKRTQLETFNEENTIRVNLQREADLTVIIGNPPYNTKQKKDSDNNSNRKYDVIDRRIAQTYASAKASNSNYRNSNYDPYIKAFRWASDRIHDEGVIAFITNNSFIDAISLDGVRHHLEQEFDAVYIIDLGGSISRSKKGEKVSSAFDIKLGVAITFLIKHKKGVINSRNTKIYYHRVTETGDKDTKFESLNQTIHYNNLTWTSIMPVNKLWLTEGLRPEFQQFLPIGSTTKTTEGTIFEIFSNGIKTNRDSIVYDFDAKNLLVRMNRFIEDYNSEVYRYNRAGKPKDINQFVKAIIKWDGSLKDRLKSLREGDFSDIYLRDSMYRPFTKKKVYFDWLVINRTYQFPRIFPSPETEIENRVICLSGLGHDMFYCQIANHIVELKYSNSSNGGTQCFPLYNYAPLNNHLRQKNFFYDVDTEHLTRRDNITPWALSQYQSHYSDNSITKEDIFYSIYAILHHPIYREKYAQNLRLSLPHIPFIQGNFRNFSQLGRELAHLHLNYETAQEYSLKHIENPEVRPNLRVEAMRLNKNKTQLIVNEFLTLADIPARAYGYKLGNYSALEWVIKQYQTTKDDDTGVITDPNRLDDEGYIVRLVKQVIYVSLETLRLVDEIAQFEF